MRLSVLPFLIMVCLQFSCEKNEESAAGGGNTQSKLVAYSPTFVNNGLFPKLYTCDSQGIAPPVFWKDAPAGTRFYAVAMHSVPPTGTNHVYMVKYDIPSGVSGFMENDSITGTFGANTYADPLGYEPPCSQGLGLKYYHITVYALSAQPVFSVPPAQRTMDVLLSAINNITLDTSRLTVGYARP